MNETEDDIAFRYSLITANYHRAAVGNASKEYIKDALLQQYYHNLIALANGDIPYHFDTDLGF